VQRGWSMRRLAASVIFAAALAACGTAAPAATASPLGPTPAPDSPAALQAELAALPAGNAASGQALFSAVGCVACHALVKDVRIVGPSLAGVAARAATRKAGYSAQLYLYESITRPNATVVDGFPTGVMPQDFRARLKAQDLADLIAFLLTEQ